MTFYPEIKYKSIADILAWQKYQREHPKRKRGQNKTDIKMGVRRPLSKAAQENRERAQRERNVSNHYRKSKRQESA